MSDLQKKIDELTVENTNLKNQLQQNGAGVENLLIQIDAHKGMLNESLSAALNLRTHMIGLQKQNKQVVDHANALQKQIDTLKAELEIAKQRIAELTSLEAPKLDTDACCEAA